MREDNTEKMFYLQTRHPILNQELDLDCIRLDKMEKIPKMSVFLISTSSYKRKNVVTIKEGQNNFKMFYNTFRSKMNQL